MKIITQIDDLVNCRSKLESQTIGLIPTMGALHDGHLSLIKLSKKKCDITAVSIFINPKQFSINEDLGTYPINIDNDIELLKKLNVDILFLPSNDTMYPNDFSTYVNEKTISIINEGASRPIFFQGVLTVVLKLFNIVQPTHAFFGQKDAQQLFLVRKMVRDLNYKIKIIDVPTIRHRNGLAMSSRNKYFSPIQMNEGKIIYKSLCNAINEINAGELCSLRIKELVKNNLSHPNLIIDYISIVDKNSFLETEQIRRDVIILIAVMFYDVRLIDNIYYSSS
tara:strand:+ start:3680 stop:4519 length:840 start_codon:yes stop_codon:yes gene_type:complete